MTIKKLNKTKLMINQKTIICKVTSKRETMIKT